MVRDGVCAGSRPAPRRGDFDIWINWSAVFRRRFGDIILVRLNKLNVTSMERKVKPGFDVESGLPKRDFEIE